MTATTLPAIRQQVLDICPATQLDEVLAVRDRVKALRQQLAAIDKTLTEQLIEYIDANGDLDMGDGKRLYVGTVKKTTCPNVGRTLEALIDATNGDFGRTVECLVAQPIKPSASKPILDEDWDLHFNVAEQQDIKTGAAKRAVQVSDPRFIKH